MRQINLETATHIAGPIVKIANRHIQRCCVCGEKLADSWTGPQGYWCEGEMVQVRDGKLRGAQMELLSLGNVLRDKMPKDFCIELVER